MFQTTRRRLALWYTAVTAVLLLLFATGFYLYVRSTLIERVDDTLNHVVEVIERSLVIESDKTSPGNPFRINVDASFRNNADALEDDHIDLEWFSPTGELLWSTLPSPVNIPLHPKHTGETVQLPAGELLRQVTERVEIGRQVLGYLRVSHPWFEVTKPIRQLMVDLSLGTTGTIISVAAIGWFLSGLAMEPVRASYQSLKQFTADASHELRNPIATIQTNVQVALADPDLDPALLRQQLQVVERLTRRLGRLVDDLLFLARQDSGMVKPDWGEVPLDALLIEVMEEQQAIADEAGIALSVDIAAPQGGEVDAQNENAFILLGDWNQLARLVTNLVSNAVQYTPSGGKVNVGLQCIGSSDRPIGAYLQVKVSDTGIGIPEDALPHLFDRFYRVDLARTHGGKAAGSGLGLAIALAIVQNHQGHIRVESQLDRGTTITVSLPVPKTDELRLNV